MFQCGGVGWVRWCRWEVKFQGTIPMDYMLSLKPKGALKIGLDAGGGPESPVVSGGGKVSASSR